MKMKAKRKVERDATKRTESRARIRGAQANLEGADESLDDLDLEVARSLKGYDE